VDARGERDRRARRGRQPVQDHRHAGERVRPVEIDESNPFAYQPREIEGGKLLPDPNGPAGERAPQGALILFKLKRFSLDNRPLELEIENPEGGPPSIVNLDV
jgi:hypothetical protein